MSSSSLVSSLSAITCSLPKYPSVVHRSFGRKQAQPGIFCCIATLRRLVHAGKISAACALFLQREGTIYCVVTGKCCFHLPHKHKLPKTAATTQRPHLLISTMNDFILADYNLAVGWSIRQTAKFNSPPNFPARW